MGARPVILMVVAVGAAVLVAAAVVRDGGSTRGSDGSAVTGRAPTTTRPPPATAPPATTTTAPVAARGTAEAVGSETSALGAEYPGLVITNSGSATASVGGNVVSGVPVGSPTVGVVTGDATAVGNSSSARTP